MKHLISLVCIVVLAACSSPSAPTAVGARWIYRENCPGPYPAQETSLYILPYEPGQSFTSGGNCSGSHALYSQDQYAYDFVTALDPLVPMPIATHVVAARAGEVTFVEERFADSTRTTGQGNGIFIRHDDGSIGMYWHLTTNGALVEVGDRVAQGQVIALSGDSGDSTAPHLHFGVYPNCGGCSSIPITFRNTRPHPRGLIRGESYRAQ